MDLVKYEKNRLELKYDAELSYWKSRHEIEKKLQNHWYKNLFLYIAEKENDSFIEDKIIADFGCGPRGSLAWATKARISIGIDVLVQEYLDCFGVEMTEHNMCYVTSSEHFIPLPSEFADIVSTINSMDHVQNFSEMSRELVRILKPNGLLIASFNINEEETPTEPLTLTEEIIRSFMDQYFNVINCRIAYKGLPGNPTYENFQKGELVEHASKDKPAIMWISAKKKSG